MQVTDIELLENNHTEMLVLLPPTQIYQWLSQYPQTYIHGSIQIQSETYDQIAHSLEQLSLSGTNDKFYLQNNVENMKEFKSDAMIIRLLIYGLNFVVICSGLFVIHNLLSQYFAVNKHEITLLHILEATDKMIKKQFILRSCIFTLTGCIISSCIEIGILTLFNKMTKTVISYLDIWQYAFIYTIILFFIISCIILRQLKTHINKR